MARLWRIVAEVAVQPGDMDSGLTKGFMNVITWAETPAEAERRLAKYVASFNWRVMAIEIATPIADDSVFNDDEMNEMFERARANRDAIILGTFHGYKPQ